MIRCKLNLNSFTFQYDNPNHKYMSAKDWLQKIHSRSPCNLTDLQHYCQKELNKTSKLSGIDLTQPAVTGGVDFLYLSYYQFKSYPVVLLGSLANQDFAVYFHYSSQIIILMSVSGKVKNIHVFPYFHINESLGNRRLLIFCVCL